MKNLALLGLVLALSACPGPGEGNARLVGTWDELPFPGSDEDEPGVAEFRADATFQIDEGNELETGTFEEVGDTLILTNDDGTVDELPYATDGQKFTPIGLRHIGGGSGFEGQWLAEALDHGEAGSMELVLAADSTFTLDIGEETEQLTGTWREVSGALITTIEFPDENGNPVGFDLPWHSIDGTVSMIAYERR